MPALVLLSASGGTGGLLFDSFVMDGCGLGVDGIDGVMSSLVVMCLFNLMGHKRDGGGMSRGHSGGGGCKMGRRKEGTATLAAARRG